MHLAGTAKSATRSAKMESIGLVNKSYSQGRPICLIRMSLNGWVFFHGASHYEMKSLHLYKAGKFPYDWLCCKTLLSGFDIRDASIFHSEGRWWIFADTSPTARSVLGERFDGPMAWTPEESDHWERLAHWAPGQSSRFLRGTRDSLYLGLPSPIRQTTESLRSYRVIGYKLPFSRLAMSVPGTQPACITSMLLDCRIMNGWPM
jgi:hypothetical protein